MTERLEVQRAVAASAGETINRDDYMVEHWLVAYAVPLFS